MPARRRVCGVRKERFNTMRRLLFALCALLIAIIGMSVVAQAAPEATAGPYRVQITTDPAVVPVGKATLRLTVTDAAGRPVPGAQVRVLAQMPTMPMGERETAARPVSGQPGVYNAPAGFSMAGAYTASVKISGPQGGGSAAIPLATGEDTSASSGGFRAVALVPWLAGAALLLFILYRLRQTGQRVDVRGALNRQTAGGLLLLVAMLAITVYGVNHWRRPGAMTPIEAQGMAMSTPPPAGTAAVTLATTERGAVESTVRYTGQVVGYTEQDVAARVTGIITAIPLYVGSRVRAGQVVARLDTSLARPLVAERTAGVAMAEQGTRVSATEYRQALSEVARMRALVDEQRHSASGAGAELAAAHEEQANAQAQLVAMQTQTGDAAAQVEAAQADVRYWTEELSRMTALQAKGAVSREEFAREAAQAAGADAKLRQANARTAQTTAQVQAARAAVRKADALILVAIHGRRHMDAQVETARAAVASAQATADVARSRIAQAQTGVAQAAAALNSAATTQGYSEQRAQTDGVVTQRILSPGALANAGQSILRIAQLNPIRLQVNVPEVDLAQIAVGAAVRVTSAATGGKPLAARVTSVAPAVDPVSRTGVVEAVVANRDARFAPGQYVVMEIATGRSVGALRVPANALTAGSEAGADHPDAKTASTVWVGEPDVAGRYTVHPVAVTVGRRTGSFAEILSGLQAGQRVVTSGQTGLTDGAAVTAPETVAQSADRSMTALPGSQRATVHITEQGFSPADFPLKQGIAAQITFIRDTEKTCATSVVFPDYGLTKSLPLHTPVIIALTPRRAGPLSFACGMRMLKGTAVVQ